MYRTLIIFCIFFAYLPLEAQDDYFSKEKLTKDIEQLRKTLVSIHPGLDYFTPKDVVNNMFDQSLESLPDSMTRMDFYKLLVPIVDTIKCGHTNIQLGHKLWEDKKDKDKPLLFPMELIMISNEVLVKEDFDIGDHTIPKGSQLISIDTIPVNDIIDKIALYNKGADGDNDYPERLWATAGFTGGYARFYGLKEKYVVKLFNSKLQKEQTYTINAIPQNALSKIKKEEHKANSPVTFKTIDNGSTGLLTVSSFSDKSNFQKSKGKFKKAFKEIRNKNINKLIIDFRNNGGGAIKNVKHLTRYLLKDRYLIVREATVEDDFKEEKKSFIQGILFSLAKKEIRGDEYILTKFSKKKVKPRNKLFKGEVVALINERSYSAAALTPAILKDKERATLIGAEAGGSFHLAFAGFSKYVKLSNTGIRIRVPIIELEFDVRSDLQDRRSGLLPDIYKTYTKEDLTNDTDTVLEYAVEYLNRK